MAVYIWIALPSPHTDTAQSGQACSFRCELQTC